jgi:hypothetical protein
MAAIEIGRPRIDPELSISKVTTVSRKVRFALDLVGQGVRRIDDHTGEPRRVEQSLLLVEVPAPRLLRHQPALEAVGELRDGALKVEELLVEIGAQAAELGLVAQLRRLDDLVIFRREDAVVEARWKIGDRSIGADRKHALLAVLPLAFLALAHLLFGPVALALLVVGLALLDPHLGLAGAAAFILLVLAVALVALVLVAAVALVAGVRIGVGFGLALDQLEVAKQLGRERGEGRLVVEHQPERVEIGAGLVLDPVGDEVDAAARGLGRRLAGEPLADLEAERGPERNLRAIAGPGYRVRAHPHLDRRRKVGPDPGHRPGAQRLDPGLLDRVEHRPGDLVRRSAAGVHSRIVVPKLERGGVGIAPGLRDLLRGEGAAGHRHLDALARGGGRIGRKAELQLRLAGDRPRGAGQNLAEGFEGVVAVSQR